MNHLAARWGIDKFQAEFSPYHLASFSEAIFGTIDIPKDVCASYTPEI